MNATTFGYFFLVLSMIALAFLVYTIANLSKLRITIAHPRVLVELTLFLVSLVLGILLLMEL